MGTVMVRLRRDVSDDPERPDLGVTAELRVRRAVKLRDVGAGDRLLRELADELAFADVETMVAWQERHTERLRPGRVRQVLAAPGWSPAAVARRYGFADVESMYDYLEGR